MKKLAFLSVIAGIIVVAASVSSCKKNSSSTPKPTLYDSLGGTAMVQDPSAASGTKIEAGRLLIRSIIDSTIFVIAGDSRINGHFTVLLAEVGGGNLTGFEALSKNLTDFVAVGTGAKDYTYGGKSMHAAHDPAENSRMNGKATKIQIWMHSRRIWSPAREEWGNHFQPGIGQRSGYRRVPKDHGRSTLSEVRPSDNRSTFLVKESGIHSRIPFLWSRTG